MSPWRHPPPEPTRDRAHLAAMALLALLALLAAVVMAGAAGCVPQVRPECPLGSRPTRVDTGSGVEGLASATGSLPSQSVTAGGTWKGSASADWSCAPICGKGQLLQASEEQGRRSVRCLSEKCPDAAPAGTSKLPAQGASVGR